MTEEKKDGRRSTAKSSNTPAQSFRIGEDYRDKLRLLADRRDVSQAELLRIFIDAEWDKVNKQRKRSAA